MIKCEICGKKCKNYHSLANHVKIHGLNSEKYYKTYLRKDNLEGLCEECGQLAIFYSIVKGYGRYCSIKCSAQNRSSGRRLKYRRKKANKKYKGKEIGNIMVKKAIIEGDEIIFVCECSCGKICKKDVRDITTGICQNVCMCDSCGKFRLKGNESPYWNGHGEIPLVLWSRYRKNAVKRNLGFDITIDQIWDLFLEQNRLCKLTGELISFGKCRKGICTASLDRINPEKGYSIDNVIWVHKVVNMMKSDLSLEQFLYLCKYVCKPLKIEPISYECFEGKKKKNWNGFGNIWLSYWSRIKFSANKRNLHFDISIKDIWNRFMEQRGYCNLTGVPIIINSIAPTASLDRINSSIGYIKSNIQWVHKDINLKIKRTLNQDEMKMWCKKITKYTSDPNWKL